MESPFEFIHVIDGRLYRLPWFGYPDLLDPEEEQAWINSDEPREGEA